MDVALTERERDVLVAMIERAIDVALSDQVPPADRQRWLAQVPGTRVVGRCPCGTCPSVDLAISDDPEVATGRSRVVLEAATAQATLLLFIDDDHLSYLELAPMDSDARFAEFPAVEMIHFSAPAPN